tara:strand:- start:1024 stop:1305 length:282 start_codon:yes stop_codon:yes gene_type:complete
MFRIPSFHQEEFTFEDAVGIMTSHGRGDLLEGMNSMDRIWSEYCASQTAYDKGTVDEMMFADDDDFYSHYSYETNAFNVVFENMSKLFAPKAA